MEDKITPQRFAFDPDAIREFENTILSRWRSMVDDAKLDALEKSINHLPSWIVIESLGRHLADTRTNARGEPMGKYPPEAADLLSHSEAISRDMAATERKRKLEKERDEYNKQIWEKRAHARQEVQTQGEEVVYDSYLSHPEVQNQIRISGQIREQLRMRYRKLEPADFARLLMGVLAILPSPYTEASVSQALETAVGIHEKIMGQLEADAKLAAERGERRRRSQLLR